MPPKDPSTDAAVLAVTSRAGMLGRCFHECVCLNVVNVLLAWWCCTCVGGRARLSFGERCSLLCNPPVLHNLRQSAVPVFAPRNLHLLLLLLPLSPLRCAVSSVREQPALPRCRLFFFYQLSGTVLVLQSRCQRTACRDGVGVGVGGCSPGAS